MICTHPHFNPHLYCFAEHTARGASPFKLPNFYEKSEENMDQGSSRVDLFVLPGFPSLSPVSVHVVSLSVS